MEMPRTVQAVVMSVPSALMPSRNRLFWKLATPVPKSMPVINAPEAAAVMSKLWMKFLAQMFVPVVGPVQLMAVFCVRAVVEEPFNMREWMVLPLTTHGAVVEVIEMPRMPKLVDV